MSGHIGEDTKLSIQDIFNDIEFVFEAKLFKTTEELKLRREADVHNELKVKNLVEEKHELEKINELTINENKNLKDYIEKLQVEHRKIIESKNLQLEDEKAALNLNVRRQSEEILSLRNDAREAELEKLTLEKQLRDVECEFKIHKSSCEKHVSQLTEVNQFIRNIQQRQKQLLSTQERLENYVQKSVEYIGQLQSAFQHRQCILTNLQNENTKLSEELDTLKLQSTDKIPSKVEKELKEQIVKMDLKINFQTKEIEDLKSQNNKFQVDNEKTMFALLQANQTVNKYMTKTTDANTEVQKLQEVCHAQEIELNRNRSLLHDLLNKSTCDKATQIQVDDNVIEDLLDDLLQTINHNKELNGK